MKKVITFGEVLMRLTTPNFARFSQSDAFNINFGGGEANVSSSLAIMGIPASHVTVFPDNDLGYAARTTYLKYGVGTEFMQMKGNRIGIYFVENGAAMRPSKVIYDRFDSAFALLNPADFDWETIFADAQWFHFTGISPAISASAAEACLQAVKVARRMGLTISADVGYRKNLWQWGKKPSEVMPELIAHCDVIICSKGDANDMFGITPNDEKGSFKSICQQILTQFPQAKFVLNTKRGQISASHNTLSGQCWNGTEMIKTKTIDIPNIVDRIGGGDAFMAGFIYAYITFQDIQKALEYGVAASALKHTVEGDFNLATLQEIEMVVKGDVSGKLKR